MCNVLQDDVDNDRVTAAAKETLVSLKMKTETWLEGLHAVGMALQYLEKAAVESTRNNPIVIKAEINRVINHYVNHAVILSSQQAEDLKAGGAIPEDLKRALKILGKTQSIERSSTMIDDITRETNGIEIGTSDGLVTIEFDEPMAWMGISPEQAEAIAGTIKEAAGRIRLDSLEPHSGQVH